MFNNNNRTINHRSDVFIVDCDMLPDCVFLVTLNMLMIDGILYCLHLSLCISELVQGTLLHLRQSSMQQQL